jgi:hypothetical protein
MAGTTGPTGIPAWKPTAFARHPWKEMLSSAASFQVPSDRTQTTTNWPFLCTRLRAEGDSRSAAKRCGRIIANQAARGPEATPERASVCSDRRAQALMRLSPFRALGRVSQQTLDFRVRLMSWTRPWPRRPPVRAAAVPRRTGRRAGPSGREPQSNRLRMPASTRSMVSRRSPPWGDGSNALGTDEIRCL